MRVRTSAALVSAFASVLAAVLASPAMAHEGGEVTAAMVKAAEVTATTVWHRDTGYLIGDSKTVVLRENSPDSGRTVYVYREPNDAERVEAEVQATRFGSSALWVLRLPTTLKGAKHLELAVDAPTLGQEVLYLERDRQQHSTTLARTAIASVSSGRISLMAPESELSPGTPVLDTQGHVVAMITHGRVATRLDTGLDTKARRGRGLSVQPLFGVRAGGEIDGSLDGAFLLDFDFGVTIGDIVSLAFRLGFSLDGSERFRSLAPAGTFGPGVVEEDRHAFRAAFEPRLRLLLLKRSFPVYLDLAVTVQYAMINSEPNGPAWHSADATCDPATQACALIPRPRPDDESIHTVGLGFGGDLRIGTLSIGYRFHPSELGHDVVTAHQILAGFSIY